MSVAAFYADQAVGERKMPRSRSVELPTKDDFVEVRTELKQDIAKVREVVARIAANVAKDTVRIEGLERAMEALRQEFRDGFESFRLEVTAKIDGLRGETVGMRGEIRMIKWMVGGIFALMVPMVGGIIGIALRLGLG